MRSAKPVYLTVMLASFHVSMALEHMLKDYRIKQAALRDLPCYSVFGDLLIREVVERKPRDLESLSLLKGMTEQRCEWFGGDILRMVRQAQVARAPDKAAPPEQRVLLRHGGAGSKITKPRIGRSQRAPAPYPARAAPPARRVLEPSARPGAHEDDVYVLELSGGRVYVGKSGDVGRRVGQHMAGGGSAFTKAFPPTGHLLPRLGNVRGNGDAAERDETLRYMFLRGIRNVRGWRYTCVELSDEMFEDAERNIRELFDLCRRCGGGNHFMGGCRFEFDRLGRRIR
jgi:predicted GIY-YIG superfamily endonuclease